MESPGKSHCGTTPLTDCLGANLNVCEAGNKQTWKERIVQALLDQAVEGNLRAIQEVWNRIEGKPGAAATTDSAPLAVTNEVARKILEAGRGDDDNDHDDDETEADDGHDDRSDA